jgi:hypothetical protein
MENFWLGVLSLYVRGGLTYLYKRGSPLGCSSRGLKKGSKYAVFKPQQNVINLIGKSDIKIKDKNTIALQKAFIDGIGLLKVWNS